MTSVERILVADDDPALCLLLRETLQDAGYEVLIASDGDQLVRIAQDQIPDLILVDLMMPLMDGFEAIRQLRNDTRTAHLPMLILTARSASSEVVTGFESGADDYIVKPYDIDVLLARIRSHLRRAAQLPVRNPLTGLPGNVLLQAELERQINQEQPFALLYIDLDNFKAFNDAYGFARGDKAIHMLANVLADTAPREDFLGHIGGDDFAIIHYGGDPESLSQRIIAAFDQRVPELYDPIDLQRGYLRAIDRHGVARQFGLLSLSISVVSTSGRSFSSVDQISKVAAELKAAAKQTSGSSYVIDRRREAKREPLRERRGQRRPAALLIYPDQTIKTAIATTLRLRGYRPLIAHDAVAAQGLLARTPNPQLLIADPADPKIWDLWGQLPAGAPLIAISASEETRASARSRAATAVLAPLENMVEFTDQLLLHLPPPRETDEEGEPDDTDQSELIRELQARTLQLERAAYEDSLTGLPNRRHFDEQYGALLAGARAERQPVAVLMADIDNFKQINDRFGHLMGNKVLRAVADHLRAALRPGDMVARYGGEEFALVLPGAGLVAAIAAAEGIRSAVAGHPWATMESGLEVTISIGVADSLSTPDEQLLAEADRRLYAAKAAGKNRVIAE